ncbi:hypothetical protein ACIFOC_01276 [Leucobacter aridicollis]
MVLVPRAADGDEDALRALIVQHAPTMRALARRLMGADCEVDRVIRQAFMIVLTSLDGGEDDARDLKMKLLQHTCRESLARISYLDVLKRREEGYRCKECT